MKRNPVVIIVVALVVSAMLAFGVYKSRRSPGQTKTSETSMKGQLAPDFALQSLDGKTVHLSDFRGKAVLLNFWATWCQPCKIEMPWFAELQNHYASEGLQVVGIAMDDAGPQEIGKFAKDLGVNYVVLIGKEEVGDSYGGVPFLPTTISVGAVSLSVVGIKNSVVGVLELMWKPLSTRKCRSTVPGFPRVIVMVGAGDIVTDGSLLPGEISCATARQVSSSQQGRANRLAASLGENRIARLRG